MENETKKKPGEKMGLAEAERNEQSGEEAIAFVVLNAIVYSGESSSVLFGEGRKVEIRQLLASNKYNAEKNS